MIDHLRCGKKNLLIQFALVDICILKLVLFVQRVENQYLMMQDSAPGVESLFYGKVGEVVLKCPCKDCDHRKLNCHGACKGYKAWRDWKDEVNRKKAADQDSRQLSREHEIRYRKSMKAGWKNK